MDETTLCQQIVTSPESGIALGTVVRGEFKINPTLSTIDMVRAHGELARCRVGLDALRELARAYLEATLPGLRVSA